MKKKKKKETVYLDWLGTKVCYRQVRIEYRDGFVSVSA